MRSLAIDPNSRENFMLVYRLLDNLVRRHHLSDRLYVLGYINKTKGYYTIYLTQDPASPLSSAFGYFNVSLGNFRSSTDNEVYYYFNEYKDGIEEEKLVEKIESMIKLPYREEIQSNADHLYVICVGVLAAIVQIMGNRETGFAVENEICPYMGPYSRVPDNRLWHELLLAITKQGQILKERCTYDFFAVGTGVPSGPVYRAWGFIANDGNVYSLNKEPLNIVSLYQSGKVYEDIAEQVMKFLESN